jgi:hypothetical protein
MKRTAMERIAPLRPRRTAPGAKGAFGRAEADRQLGRRSSAAVPRGQIWAVPCGVGVLGGCFGDVGTESM